MFSVGFLCARVADVFVLSLDLIPLENVGAVIAFTAETDAAQTALVGERFGARVLGGFPTKGAFVEVADDVAGGGGCGHLSGI